jgi:hypothetical protein
MKFNYERDFSKIDFRKNPEEYQVGIGEQGVLMVQPYKSEILPMWKFATPEDAQKSSEAIYAKYLEYKAAGDFVGMDMARKYLQMGWTRARRYTNHKGGRKYDAEGNAIASQGQDPVKAESARIFRAKLEIVLADEEYANAVRAHKEKYEPKAPPKPKSKTKSKTKKPE